MIALIATFAIVLVGMVAAVLVEVVDVVVDILVDDGNSCSIFVIVEEIKPARLLWLMLLVLLLLLPSYNDQFVDPRWMKVGVKNT